jgi:antitoxin component of MazEF toxin-antitoxin module
MQTNIRKWGNSAGAIIPAAALAKAGIALGDSVDVVAEDGQITIKSKSPEYTLEALLDATPAKATTLSKEDREWLDMKSVGREID